MNKQSTTIVAIVIVGITALVLAVMSKNKPEVPKKEVTTTLPLVEVIEPTYESVQFSVESHGVVQPRTETTLISEVSGVVQSVSDKFIAGGYFNAGETLLVIDPSDYEVAVEQAKARLVSAQAKYAQEKARAEQAQKEWDLSGRSRSNAPSLALREPFLLEAQANVQSAEADLKKAEQKLYRTVIKAPFAGMVKEKRTDIGQFVSMGTPLGVTFAIDYAEVRLPLTDQELAFIQLPDWNNKDLVNAPTVILSANYAGSLRSWPAKLVRMEGVVDQTSRVHYAVARISDPYSVLSTNKNVPLKMGTFVSARIEGIEAQNVMKLPRDVFRNLTQVLVADQKSELHLRDLQVLRSDAKFVYVQTGLTEGDAIVTTAIESPVQGAKVRVAGRELPDSEYESEKENEEAFAGTTDESQPR